ncbi:peptidoglycan editing factor PgeF [Neokomagataea tanensis]|uniref:Purine nucleoside phosphorylase n=1 Tax=Neokomagataea tanensis TaxID=661191 RepID=A0A4Y6V5C7_9PROT|nr:MULTISPECIES: peptidoglycan editing factor PgeF [Neokomagataea]QDH24554.1 peptidoglycan editing factor PgeF [Neokomagataea tanensis]
MPDVIVPDSALLRSTALHVPHAFFTRLGGVSPAPFDSLNGSLSSVDDPENIRENRARIAHTLGVHPQNLLGLKQTHSAIVHTIRHGTEHWLTGRGPEGDALVTDSPDIAVSTITADCGPLLLASADGRIVGAAHAGWRGAVGGVIEAVIDGMRAIGAVDIRAVVGPCIGKDVYETGQDMYEAVTKIDSERGPRFFRPAPKEGHFLFDLSGYCADRLRAAGVSEVQTLNVDTLTDERFFSHRRRTLAGGGHIGHQVSAIRPI